MTFVQLRDAILALVATRSLAERWSEVELPKLAHRELDLADDAPIPPELPDGKAADIAAAYIEALHLKFADQRLDDLGKLHQVKMRERGENRETPSQYHARFENVAAQLRGLSDRQKVEAFLLWLPEGLVDVMRTSNASTRVPLLQRSLQELADLAEAVWDDDLAIERLRQRRVHTPRVRFDLDEEADRGGDDDDDGPHRRHRHTDKVRAASPERATHRRQSSVDR